ncbi:MAG: TIR domain-containing protein, partial [Pseudomonadales bacterium]|nr:TIR domain-containing protein [Pseudomonadales bacterium]
MASDVKNVFISHIHEDDAGLGKLKDLLSKNGMDIRDASINSDKPNNATSPDYIKTEILAPQINWAGTFLVYITPETKNSEWVNWEIEYAEKQGKHIVGIWANGDNQCEVPEALDKYADAIVGWQADKIIDAI